PRPAYIEIPMDVLAGEADGAWERRSLPTRPLPADDAIAAAARLLAAARRPLIIAGGGAVAAASALSDLANLIGSPVVTTIAAKGVAADGHPLALGATLPRAATQALVETADARGDRSRGRRGDDARPAHNRRADRRDVLTPTTSPSEPRIRRRQDDAASPCRAAPAPAAHRPRASVRPARRGQKPRGSPRSSRGHRDN